MRRDAMSDREPLNYATPDCPAPAPIPRPKKVRTPLLPYIPFILALLQIPWMGCLVLVLFFTLSLVTPAGTGATAPAMTSWWIIFLPAEVGVLVGSCVIFCKRPINRVDLFFAVIGSIACAGFMVYIECGGRI